MEKVLVVIGAPGYNRGSEMLLTGILQLLDKSKSYSVSISAFSIRTEWGEQQNNRILYREFIPRESILSETSSIKDKLSVNIGWHLVKANGYTKMGTVLWRTSLCRRFCEFDSILFVGADNFDYETSKPNELNALIEIARKKSNAKLILFDLSMEDKHVNRYLLKNLKTVDVISARDSLSYYNILKYTDKVRLHADPAFAVNMAEPTNYPLKDKSYIGINISPIVERCNSNLLLNMVRVVEWILSNSSESVLLIPHVMGNQDYASLVKLKSFFSESSRVRLLEDEVYSGQELKYIISKSRFFIGARTHAMIAAYSSCVPALAIGYSIKSEGIARDLLSEDCFCIQAGEINSEREILDMFIRLWNREEIIKNALKEKMPEYIETLVKFFGEIYGDNC